MAAAMGARFIVIAEVGDAARDDKVAHGVAAVAAMTCRCQDGETLFVLPRRHAGCEQQGLRHVLPSTAELRSVITAHAEIREGHYDARGSSVPYPASRDPIGFRQL